MADGYDYVFGPSTTFGKDLMPRVAALLGVNQISDIMSVEGSHTFKRPDLCGQCDRYRRGAAESGRRDGSHGVLPGSWRRAIPHRRGSRHVASNMPDHTRFVELEAGQSDRPDLQTAPKWSPVVGHLGSAESFDIIYALADKLGAGVGASRAAVDAGYVPNDMQVGQTGKIIAPDLYIAIGISGAIQHLTGIKDAGTIVAINKDEEAPIFEVADIGLVGDLFQRRAGID